MSTGDNKVDDSMRFIDPSTMKWGIRLKDIKMSFQNVIWGSDITESMIAVLGYFVVKPTVPPQADVVTEVEPVLVDGEWIQQWEGRPYTTEELTEQLNHTKDQLLRTIDAIRDDVFATGVPFNFGTTEEPDIEHVQVRDGDRANQAGMAAQLMRQPEQSQSFRTYQDNIKQLTPEQVSALTDAAYNGYLTILGYFWSLKDDIKKAETKKELPEVPAVIEDVYAALQWPLPNP